MAGREIMLSEPVVGDIFQADGSHGARAPCLIYAVTATIIKARSATTQAHYEFSRETGIGNWRDGLPAQLVPLRRFQLKFITSSWVWIGNTDYCVILRKLH